MGRIIAPVVVTNALHPERKLRFDALVDTGTAGLVLPKAWKRRLGALSVTQVVGMETADQRVVKGEVCGPVAIRIDGFRTISSEVFFLDMRPKNGDYEPLIGYIILEQSQAAVDITGHRLVAVKHFDLK